jgi:sec-independent protein translocase protein TatC
VALSIRGRPIRFSLAWLKPPPIPPDGNMTLVEHLRELRYRLVVIVLVVLAGVIAAAFCYELLLQVLLRPFEIAKALVEADHPNINMRATLQGIGSPFTFAIKICLVASLIVTSPLWLYQIWAFIVPGLMAKEKKWTITFLAAAVPLFLAGVVLAYLVIPKGFAVMIGFTPNIDGLDNLLDLNDFLAVLIRVLVVFGAGFELPVFVVGLHLTGLLTAHQISRGRSVVIFLCFVFGAVATPQTDPISMLLLAAPMAILYVVAEVIVHIRERNLARRGKSLDSADRGIQNDRALAELDGREPDAEQPTTARQTVADLLGLDPSPKDGSEDSKG